MEKYYTPKIEEFYVGFECEMKNSSDLKFFEWEVCTFKDDFSCSLSEDYCFEYLTGDLKDENIRVKFLDKIDIESLNFIKEFSTTSSNLNYPCEVYSNFDLNLMLAHYPELNKVSIITKDFSKKPSSIWDENQVNLIFVKNKSELKKLLSQLNVKI